MPVSIGIHFIFGDELHIFEIGRFLAMKVIFTKSIDSLVRIEPLQTYYNLQSDLLKLSCVNIFWLSCTREI